MVSVTCITVHVLHITTVCVASCMLVSTVHRTGSSALALPHIYIVKLAIFALHGAVTSACVLAGATCNIYSAASLTNHTCIYGVCYAFVCCCRAADGIVQQLRRTHRANQPYGPKY
jgi:uncharacterized membrane protein